jgi:hypothetical protein
MEVLVKNTVEPLIVDMRDRLESISDLATVTNLRFDVKDKDGNAQVTNGIPTPNGMKAICVIDSTGVGWTEDEYHVYIKFQDGSTTPYLFAGKFRLTNIP